MEKLGLNEIREKYLSFFESKGHLRLQSFPLVPQNDASLLLINAGMAPLKPYFTGKEVPPRKRVTTCQKCIRTPDIERVGKTARHGTFFEMLGNFSFGDYFKHEATAWAWEFITKVLEIPEDKLWVTIYEDDDETRDIWINEIGVKPERIVRMGKEDNFWEIGTGPCGPCSEIYFDRGEEFGCGSPDCKVGCDCDRFCEFWNLVFTQFDKDEDGNYNPLAFPNIDTGMGLERIACIMQGVGSLFEVDTVRNLMNKISEVAGVSYGKDSKTDISLRVITDHIRSTSFMISDNILPSNEGRGYVLRRLLRRAARHGKLLGIEKPFLYTVVDTLIDDSKSAYPELEEKREYIKKIVKREEERFEETIDQGLEILKSYTKELADANKKVLEGEKAFKLYDTYGFPIDLTIEILEEQGYTVDREGFDKEMQAQRVRAREARKEGEEAGWSEDIYTKLDKDINTEFIGYNEDTCSAKVLALIADGALCDTASDGQNVALIFDKTVFYGESGGQVGDKGTLSGEGFKAEVYDTKKMAGGRIVHFVNVLEGSVQTGDTVSLSIDKEQRLSTQRNHSATHLLQKALEEVVGDHIAQAGSYVTPERLRFDFSHFEAVNQARLLEVEQKVNMAILSAMAVTKNEMPIAEARKLGAKALFGEKYGEVVRVVAMGDYSIELCGGCHVDNTSEIGLFKILTESSVAAGVRRIEGITGKAVLDYIKEKDAQIERVASLLKANKNEIENKINATISELADTKKELESLKLKMAGGKTDELLQNAKQINGVNFVSSAFEGMASDELRSIGDKIKEKLGCAVVVLAGITDEKIIFMAMASKEAVDKGIHAGNIVREVAAIAGGKGGGKPDFAQAGGKDKAKVAEALARAEELVAAL